MQAAKRLSARRQAGCMCGYDKWDIKRVLGARNVFMYALKTLMELACISSTLSFIVWVSPP